MRDDRSIKTSTRLPQRVPRIQTRPIAMMPSSHPAFSHGLTGLLAVALLLGACQTDTPQQEQQTEPELPDDELAIEDPWVRPASRGDSTALYMTIANGRSSADTLVGAQQAPIYKSVTLYAPASDTAMAPLQQVESLTIPARTRMTLGPDSAHVVLTNLTQPLEEGGTLLVTMEFAQSGLQQIRAPVRTSSPSEMQ